MKKRRFNSPFYSFLIFLAVPICCFAQSSELSIFEGYLKSGYQMGVTSPVPPNWASKEGSTIRMECPPNQGWAAVYLTKGHTQDDNNKENRQVIDVSSFETIIIEVKGEKEGDILLFAIKDRNTLNFHNVKKKKIRLSTDWQTIPISINTFTDPKLADEGYKVMNPNKIHVVADFSFPAPPTKKVTAYFRKVVYQK